MLNSAAGVMLPPSAQAPPISTISRIFCTMPGFLTSAMPRLVSGPSMHSVIEASSAASSVSTRKSTVWPGLNAIAGSGRAGASNRALSRTSAAVTRRAHHGSGAAGIDGSIGPARQFADPARVLFRQAQRHIAGHGGDAEDTKLLG